MMAGQLQFDWSTVIFKQNRGELVINVEGLTVV